MSRGADAPKDDSSPLADPALRLAAVVVDAAVALAPLLLLVPLSVVTGWSEPVGWGFVTYLVLQPAVLVVNLVLLHRYGQTIGKRALGLRIVCSDGTRAPLGRIWWRRIVIPGLIGAVPLVGHVFALADAALVFTDRRRTIHDRIADTIVVDLRRAPPAPPREF